MSCRGDEIAKEIIAHKDDSGTWKARQQQSTASITSEVHEPSGSENDVAVKEQSNDSIPEKQSSLTPDSMNSCQTTTDSCANNLTSAVPVCIFTRDTSCTATSSQAAVFANSLSMSDDSLAALLVLASEKDIMMQLSTENIIACLVRENPSLMMHLMH
jgi:hypothetical protein